MSNKKFFLFTTFILSVFLITTGCSLKKVSFNNGEIKEKNQKENNEATGKNQEGAIKGVRPINDSDHIKGDKNALVKLVVYSDFQCPYCARFTKTLEEIEKEFGEKVVMSFRHFPLSFHSYAFAAAAASECASEQGKFWEMHDKIFADNISGKFNAEQFKEDAGAIGLDKEKFSQCLDVGKYNDKINNDIKEGKEAGVNGTPTAFVNGEIVPGAYPFEDFKGSNGQEVKGMESIVKKYLK